MRKRSQTAIKAGIAVSAIVMGSKAKLSSEKPQACANPNRKHDRTAPHPQSTRGTVSFR